MSGIEFGSALLTKLYVCVICKRDAEMGSGEP